MTKIYFQKSTGFICYRHPYNYTPESENDFIEVEDDIAEETLGCPYDKIWAIVGSTPKLIDNQQVINSAEYKEQKIKNEIISLKQYLNDTDYVITKLNELKLEDENEYNVAKEKYSTVLLQRKQARSKINELENK